MKLHPDDQGLGREHYVFMGFMTLIVMFQSFMLGVVIRCG